MATTFRLTEESYIYPLYLPVDINGLSAADGNYISMKNYNHATIIVLIGACAATASMTIKRATTVAGGSAEAWTGWDYAMVNANASAYNAEDASDTENFTLTAVTSYTKATGTTPNQVWVVEFDAIDLGGGAWDCFSINFTDPGNADIVGAVAILTGARYTGAGTNAPTARTD